MPSDQSLADAIEAVDAATGQGLAYYMINCAHPTHFVGTLRHHHPSFPRICANASYKSHAELDIGDPDDLGQRYLELQALLPNLTVIGGCCGTDHRHVEKMGLALNGTYLSGSVFNCRVG